MVIMMGSFFVSFQSSFALTETDTVLAEVQISVCGDGAAGGDEECDGNDLNGATCQSRGFSGGGSLACSAACDFDTSTCRQGGGGGGGGGGSLVATAAGVSFSGKAYPGRSITILKDAQVAVTTVADANADFKISLSNISAGTYLFSVYSEDNRGLRSNLLTFPVSITNGTITTISGIFVPPSLEVNKTEVKKGENLGILGQSTPNSEISIVVNSDQDFLVKTGTDQNGLYFQNFDTNLLDEGEHFAKAKTNSQGQLSSFSKAVGFTVGDKTVLKTINQAVSKKGDLSGDNKVNLIDFSILAYWYKRPQPPAKNDLNADGKVDLIDFSIMAFHWTG